ncbi:hypothetical protein [Priestia megaterium]|uniref:hypothetical protein n=1 Tax=Priestia megaterium TaxID=1404 RepID=UPI00188E30FB|nr:hypothetical protein [Priestia megaterium]
MLKNLKQMANENDLSLTILVDEELNTKKVFGMFYHRDDCSYEDHVVHRESAYFLVDEQEKLFYQQQQTSSFSPLTSIEIKKIVQYNM